MCQLECQSSLVAVHSTTFNLPFQKANWLILSFTPLLHCSWHLQPAIHYQFRDFSSGSLHSPEARSAPIYTGSSLPEYLLSDTSQYTRLW